MATSSATLKEAGPGPLPVLQTFRGKEPFSARPGGIQKERVMSLGRVLEMSDPISTAGFYFGGNSKAAFENDTRIENPHVGWDSIRCKNTSRI